MPGMRPWGNQPIEVWIAGSETGGGDQVAVTNWPETQPVSGTVNATCSGTVAISGSVAVTGTFWQATQPISATSLPLPTGASSETTLSSLNGKVTACNTGAVTVSSCALPTGAATSAAQGTGNTSLGNIDTKTPALGQATMANSRPVVIASNQSAVPVSGTFWQATQPVSGTFWQATQPVSGPLTDAQLRAAPVPISGNLTSAPQPSTLCVTATGAAAAAVTLTLPAIAGQFHYITSIQINGYATAAVTGTATPVLVTSTNIPGNPVWTFARARAVGTTDIQSLTLAGNALKSSVVNTATTIVCPATTSILWRVTVTYYGAA
jgi:hypothetical protein